MTAIEPVEAKELFAALKAAQTTTLLSEDELLELLAAKQDTILTWRCTARIRRHYDVEVAAGARLPESQESRFVGAGTKIRLEDDFEAYADRLGLHSIMTEAEGVSRIFNKRPPVDDRGLPAIEAGGENRPAASIQSRPDPNIMGFYTQSGNVIGQCMLVPADKRGVGKAGAGLDITYALKGEGILLAGEHDVDGTPCICIGSGLNNFYLDIEHGFALRKLEQRPRFQTRQIAFVKNCSEFTDCGDGVWLPSKITNIWYNANGEVATREEVGFSDMAINCEVDPAVFTDIIPANTWVNDDIKGITYVSGAKGSIAQLIELSVPSTLDGSSGGRRMTPLIMGNLATLAVIVVIWCWKKRSPVKQED